MLRHTTNPVERALAMVIVARAIADHAAAAAAATRDGNTAELVSAEQVLTASLEHLHRVRADSYQHDAAAEA